MNDIIILIIASMIIAGLHALIPDHEISLIIVAHVRNWSLRHLILATITVGALHILISSVMATLMFALSAALADYLAEIIHLISAIVLIIFGIALMITSFKSSHFTQHNTHEIHKTSSDTLTLLIISLGMHPCFVLIPIFFVASFYGIYVLLLVIFVFAVSTILTMIAIVIIGFESLEYLFKMEKMEKHMKILSGIIIVLIGIWMILID